MAKKKASAKRGVAFQTDAMRVFARELLFAPAANREAYVERAEALHDAVELGSTYPLSFVTYRVTGVRVELDDDPLLVGDALRADLRRVIDAVSKSVELAAPEPSDTVESLATRLSVSTKTVHRWRQRGLRWRWAKRAGATRHYLVFTPDAVAAFEAAQPGAVARAGARTNMTEAEKRALLRRARRLARATDATITPIARHLARRTGRSFETVRSLLDKHDRAEPESAIFPDHVPPLSARQRELVLRASRRGVSATRLGDRLGKGRATVYRVLRQARHEEAVAMPLGFVTSVLFEREDAELVLGTDREGVGGTPRPVAVETDDLPASVRGWYTAAAVSDELVAAWFRRFHYARYRAARAREAIDPKVLRAAELDAFDRWVSRADALRGRVVRASLPVVLSVARRRLPEGCDVRADPGPLLARLVVGHRALYAQAEVFNPFHDRPFRAALSTRLVQAVPGPEADEWLTEAAALHRFWSDAAAARVELPG